MDVSEKAFESTIEAVLLGNQPVRGNNAIAEARPFYGGGPGGYRKRLSADYDGALCLIPDDVLSFLYVTQPKEWKKFEAQLGSQARAKFLQRLASEIQGRGTVSVLRKGIKANGCKFALAYFRPASGLNTAIQTLYEANIFSVVRQLAYSQKNDNTLDIALFLNGIPLFTAELKNPLTGQDVQNAIRQYATTRGPHEPLFHFGRCLAHFAVDPDLVYVTTRLAEAKTRFLPFNRGRGLGAGNPVATAGFATSYLWEQIWARDSVLDLIQNFVHLVEETDDEGRKTGERVLLFPRYHQLDAVRRLVADARAAGPGRRYLIQHSAGSGKSNSIAWLAHQLVGLHDAGDRRVFDSIIVVTDRRVLDRQLQGTVHQFEQTLGVVENIDKTSRQLKAALEDGKNIIVTTLQKFPVIAKEVQALPGQRFAVIIDEAHSSQSGESTKDLKKVLTAGSLEAAEEEERDEGEDLEDRVVAEMRARGRLPNVSFFAFTATPKAKTLELFGEPRPDGKFAPFSLYSMRQAIEEGFILDVLQNYTTHKSYFSLLKKIENDPRYDRQKAIFLLKSFVDLHAHTIATKVVLMVDHFHQHSAERIGGKAKAMIVTRSRLHAVRFKLAVDRYLRDQGYPYKALVAFSGTVRDGGRDYTEAGMNGFPEARTAETFKGDAYRFLIVANKFQTGFDQPLLHTMYVDKKLGGVNAVQTLSRLNRVAPGKEETMVLDFANEADDIQRAFEPYYERTLLTEATDPNLLYDLEGQLVEFHVYTGADITKFAGVYYGGRSSLDKLYAILDPIVARYADAEECDRVEFRAKLTDYVRLYAFLSQVITFVDADLERLYTFGRLLLRKLPVSRDELPLEIQQNINMESFRIRQTSSGRIPLGRNGGDLNPIGPSSPVVPAPEDLEPLSQILRELNDRFGTDFSEDDKVFVQQLESLLSTNADLQNTVRVNSPENARLSFDLKVRDMLQEMVDTNFKFYKQVNDDPKFGKFFLQWLFERYLERSQLPKAG